MNIRKWWNLLTQDVKNAFMIVDEGSAQPRWNIRAIGSCIFRVGLYAFGTFLVCVSLVNALSLWDLDPFVVNAAGGLALILAGVGLFFFFRLGFYRRRLKWTTYLWWILGSFVGLAVLLGILSYSFVPSNALLQQDLFGDAFGGLLGITLIVIAYVRGKAPPIAQKSSQKSEVDAYASRVIQPKYRFAELILPPNLLKDLKLAVGVLQSPAEELEGWGLSADARPSYVALHLYGKPGTGKTLAAHALADYMSQSILPVTYADLDADTYSAMNKNIQAVFETAAKKNALLLIDDADVLFTKGISQITSNQFRTWLDQFHGVMIFATNTIENYNKAFETRVRHIHIPPPEEEGRQRLWEVSLPATLPRADDVEPAVLARKFGDLNGREIRRILTEAVQKVQAEQRSRLELSDLEELTTRLKKGRLDEENDGASGHSTKTQYVIQRPKYIYEQLILPQSVKEELFQALGIIRNETQIFDKWGLQAIEPSSYTALSFYGQPGTGKTLAAHALASYLDRPILVANYAEIQGVYIGEGPKNVDTIFRTAARENAVLFIDEADALLARRLGDVSHSGDMMLNALSNQMLIALENFHGVVIFATNMAQSYDKAFETRVRHIRFPLPDAECRKEIWRIHLPEKLPRAEDIDLATLAAQSADMCGRDIKNAVIDAATKVQADGRKRLEMADLLLAIKRISGKRLSEDSNALREATRDYIARKPLRRYEQLILNKNVEDELLTTLNMIQNEAKLFDEWDLRSIEPFPCTALSFYGPPGTGKTLAAHALADRMGKNILVANYGEVIGRYVGDGARNLEALFRTAARENAVVFIDEADTLLARRLTTVTISGDMELNSITTQMLMCIENFRGLVIFATNMFQSYDKAFETRVRHIHFPLPDEECRQRLWRAHLPSKLPLVKDVDVVELAALSAEMCGRDIKNAVLEAATKVDRDGREEVASSDLVAAIKRIKNGLKNNRGSQQGEQEDRRQRIMDLLQHELSSGQVGQNGAGKKPEVPETPVPEHMESGQNGVSGEEPTHPLIRPESESEEDTPTQRLIRPRGTP
jgi:ATP-dependent 26S proteasome regulatory subunit